MVSLQQVNPSNANIRLCFATLLCLIFLLALMTAWEWDLLPAGMQQGSLSIGQTDTDSGSLTL